MTVGRRVGNESSVGFGGIGPPTHCQFVSEYSGQLWPIVSLADTFLVSLVSRLYLLQILFL